MVIDNGFENRFCLVWNASTRDISGRQWWKILAGSQDETKGSAETKCGRLSLALFALSTTFYADYILDLIRRLDQGATITHSKNSALLLITVPTHTSNFFGTVFFVDFEMIVLSKSLCSNMCKRRNSQHTCIQR